MKCSDQQVYVVQIPRGRNKGLWCAFGFFRGRFFSAVGYKPGHAAAAVTNIFNRFNRIRSAGLTLNDEKLKEFSKYYPFEIISSHCVIIDVLEGDEPVKSIRQQVSVWRRLSWWWYWSTRKLKSITREADLFWKHENQWGEPLVFLAEHHPTE